MLRTIDEAIKRLQESINEIGSDEEDTLTKAEKLGLEALKLLKVADIEGGAHTFKGKSVEDCIFIRKSDLQTGLLAGLLKAGRKG